MTITFAGDGAGWVETGEKRCTSSCTIDDPASVVHLLAGTPSTFGGWSSSCDNAQLGGLGPSDCELVVDRDIDLTVTFNRDPGELATLFPPDAVSALAFAGDDLVIASMNAGTIRRVAVDGSVRWEVASHAFGYVPSFLGAPPPNMAVSATGDLYTLEGEEISHGTFGPAVVARHGDGSVAWMSPQTLASAVATMPDGGVVAMSREEVVRLAAADGSVVWTAAVADAVSVAVDSTGMIAVATTAGTVARFDAAGTRLTPDWSLPWALPSSIAFDAQDFLVAQLVDPSRPDWSGTNFCGPGGRTLARLDRTGTAVFRVDEDCIEGLPSGLVPDGPDLFSFQPGEFQTDPHIAPYFHPGGLTLRTYGLDGAQGAWTLSKPVLPTYNGLMFTDATSATTAACDGHGRCAVAGTYALGLGSYWPMDTSPWVEVLSVP